MNPAVATSSLAMRIASHPLVPSLRPARRRGELEGIESRVDWGRDRRSVVHPPATVLEQVRPCAGRFMPLRGACVINGIPRRAPGAQFGIGGIARINVDKGGGFGIDRDGQFEGIVAVLFPHGPLWIR